MSSQTNNVEEKGRIRYIEPNLINEYSSYRDIPHPYEDYCISVDMKVKVPRRDSFGNKSIMDTAWSGTTRTFMNGTDGSLTSNYTEISMVNPKNNTVECLGIENIDISFDAWMHPLVTIKFVDVRAAALFGSQEQAYYNTSVKENEVKKSTASLYGGSFYKVLFSMPSPLFQLTLKGFYGKPVTLDLAISSYKSNFNSQTGCFEMTVTFVGYMYGVYVDLPLSYAVLAPYLSIGDNDNWNTNTNFYYKNVDGTLSDKHIITYTELRKAVATANANLDKLPPSENTKRLYNLELEESALNELTSYYEQMLSSVFNSEWGGFYEHKYIHNESNPSESTYFLAGGFTVDSQNGWPTSKNILMKTGVTGVQYWKDASTAVDTFVTQLTEYNKTHNNMFSDWNVQSVLTVGSRDDLKTIPKKNLEGNGMDYISNFLKGKNFDLLGDCFTSFCNKANTVWSGGGKNYNLIFYGEKDPFGIGCNLYKRKFEILKEKGELQKLYAEELSNNKIQLVEFDYSIGNMYRMLFAHMETFVDAFYNMLTEAYSEGSDRTLSAFGKNVDETDLPINWDVTKPVPPFTYFYKQGNESDDGKSERQVVMWPDVDIAETRFINRMLMAAIAFGKEEASVTEYIERLNSTSGTPQESIMYDSMNYGESVVTANDFLGITPHDLVTSKSSPYEYLKDENIQNVEHFYQYVLLTFAIRYAYFCMKSCTEQTLGNLSEMFGKVEANNFKFSHVKKTTQIEKLLGQTSDGFIDFITTNQEKLKLDKPFNGPVFIEKDKDKYDYTFCTDDMERFPISMDNPTKLSKLPQKDYRYFAKLDGDNFNIDDDVWVFTEPKVMCDYRDKANKTLSDSKDRKSYISVIGESSDKVKEKVLKTPSYVFDDKDKKVYPLYGHKFFYMQNNHEDPTTKLYAKAYAFLMGVNVDINESLYGEKYENHYLIPLLRVLIVGAAQYRYDYMSNPNNGDLIIHDGYRGAASTELYMRCSSKSKRHDYVKGFALLAEKPSENESENFYYASMYNEDRTLISENNWYGLVEINSNFARAAKKVFINWVEGNSTNGTFLTINNYLEICDVEGADVKFLNGTSFVNYIASISKSKRGFFKTTRRINMANTNVYQKEYEINTTTQCISNLEITFGEGTDVLTEKLESTFGDYGAVNTSFSTKSMTYVTNTGLVKAFDSFITTLNKLYKNIETQPSQYVPMSDSEMLDKNNDLKLSIYLTLRNLYDRWFANGKPENWKLDVDGSDFNTFRFVNSVFKDAYNLMTNVDNVSNLVTSYAVVSSNMEKNPTRNFLSNDSKSIYDFLAHVAQDTGGILMALPIADTRHNTGGKDVFSKNINTMFTPYSYNSNVITASTTYLFMYPQKPSEHLAYDNQEDNDYQYKDDGFTISGIVEMPMVFTNQTDSYDVPVFGVSYGRQNQSIFKDISVNMDVPQVTEASIAATMNIASRSGVGPREQVLYGQDLYKVFSNYSYTCSVEMMGDMQIMPLMYFQLNNIPLFKGIYQIMKVEHSFTPGNATTKFVGVRVNRYQTPIVKTPFFTGDNSSFRGNSRNLGSGITYVGVNFKTYGFIDSQESIDFIRRIYEEVKAGKYDKMSSACKKQVITVDGTGDLSLSKGQSLSTDITSNLENLRGKLQEILDAWCEYCVQNKLNCQQIRITSGYRSPEKNSNTKGASMTSQHMYGNAADWQPIETGSAREIFARFVIAYSLAKKNNFDQIINETSVGVTGSNWTHFGLAGIGKKGRGEIKNGLVYSNGTSSYVHKLDSAKITG